MRAFGWKFTSTFDNLLFFSSTFEIFCYKFFSFGLTEVFFSNYAGFELAVNSDCLPSCSEPELLTSDFCRAVSPSFVANSSPFFVVEHFDSSRGLLGGCSVSTYNSHLSIFGHDIFHFGFVSH